MVGETEHWSWRFTAIGINAFVAGTSTAIVNNPSPGQQRLIQPPKGSTLQLVRMHGFIAAAEGILEATSNMKIVLAKVLNTPQPPLDLEGMQAAWAMGFSRSIAGTPANAAALSDGVPIEVDFDTKHRSTSIRNRGGRGDGQPSGDLGGGGIGYSFITKASASFSFLLDVVVDYDILWHEPSGRSRLSQNRPNTGDGSGQY